MIAHRQLAMPAVRVHRFITRANLWERVFSFDDDDRDPRARFRGSFRRAASRRVATDRPLLRKRAISCLQLARRSLARDWQPDKRRKSCAEVLYYTLAVARATEISFRARMRIYRASCI